MKEMKEKLSQGSDQTHTLSTPVASLQPEKAIARALSAKRASEANQKKTKEKRRGVYIEYLRLQPISQLDAALRINVSETCLKRAIKENKE